MIINNINKYFLAFYAIITALIIVLLFTVMNKPDASKIRYISTLKLYNEFKFKVELEKKYSTIQNQRQLYLDSLMLNLKVMSKNVSSHANDKFLAQKFDELKDEYLEKKDLFEKDSQNMKSEFEKQIWTQLNQYVRDYGEKNDINIILGADGTGTLMYAEKGMDITELIIGYVNQRYVGEAN